MTGRAARPGTRRLAAHGWELAFGDVQSGWDADLVGWMRPAAAEAGAVLQRAAGAGSPRVAALQRRWRCSARRGKTAKHDQTAGAGTHVCRGRKGERRAHLGNGSTQAPRRTTSSAGETALLSSRAGDWHSTDARASPEDRDRLGWGWPPPWPRLGAAAGRLPCVEAHPCLAASVGAICAGS